MVFRFVGLLLVVFANLSEARIEVAFFEMKNEDGSIRQLEKNGRYSHVAIRHQGKWLHVHPDYGVELVENVTSLGEIKEILIDSTAKPLTSNQVNAVLNQTSDRTYTWENLESTYCSKLIAKLLKINPTPMTFDAAYWQAFRNLPRGKLGISPDELYTELKQRNFKSKIPLCNNVFK